MQHEQMIWDGLEFRTVPPDEAAAMAREDRAQIMDGTVDGLGLKHRHEFTGYRTAAAGHYSDRMIKAAPGPSLPPAAAQVPATAPAPAEAPAPAPAADPAPVVPASEVPAAEAPAPAKRAPEGWRAHRKEAAIALGKLLRDTTQADVDAYLAGRGHGAA